MEEKRKRGPKPKAPEDKIVRKNISLDEDCQVLLNQYQVELTEKLGFKPSLSQCVKYLITHQKS